MLSGVVSYIKETDFKSWNLWHILTAVHVTVLLSCVLIFLNLTFQRSKSEKCYPTRKSSPYNVLGNIFDILLSARFKEMSINVHLLQIMMAYNELFKKEKFYNIWLSYSKLIIVTKAETAEAIISGSRHMEKNWMYNWLHPWLGTGLLTSHGSKWKSRRKLLTPSFHFDILKDFLQVFNEQSEILVKILKKETEKPWIDVVNPITLCSLDIVCETTLGVSVGAQKDSESEYVKAVARAAEVFMKRMVQPLFFFDWLFALSQTGIQFKKDVHLLHDFTRKVISEKKQKLLSGEVEISTKKRKALMDLLLEQHIQNQALSEEDIREEIDTFAFEGHDTTSMGMSWAIYLIGLYKDVQEKLHEEIDRIFCGDVERPVTTDDIKDMEYLDRVLKESQRLYPSVPFFARTLSEDVFIDGYKLTKGSSASILTYCLHRNEEVFPNPEVFDPDRFLPENSSNRHPFAYIPFSAGPRNCIGQRFAIMEEKVVIANILRNFTINSLDPRDKVLALPELILRSSCPIRIKFTSRRTGKV